MLHDRGHHAVVAVRRHGHAALRVRLYAVMRQPDAVAKQAKVGADASPPSPPASSCSWRTTRSSHYAWLQADIVVGELADAEAAPAGSSALSASCATTTQPCATMDAVTAARAASQSPTQRPGAPPRGGRPWCLISMARTPRKMTWMSLHVQIELVDWCTAL